MNIASVIEGHDDQRTAIIDGDAVLTFGELRAQVAAVRAALVQHGVEPGTKVLLIGENETDFVVGALAALGTGAALAPIRSLNPFPELQRKATSVRPALTMLSRSASWVDDHLDAFDAGVVVSVADLASSGTTAPPAPIADRAADDLAFLLLTSGVTSNAKVAMLSHGNLDWVQAKLCDDTDVGLVSTDVALGVLPLTHIFGLNVVLLSTLRAGGTVVLQQRFDVVKSLELIMEHGVTLVSGAPPMWQRWAGSDVPADALKTVRHAASGASALPVKVFNEVRDRFGIELAEGYGLTETSPIVTWSRGIQARPGSVGIPLDGVEVMLVEPDGTVADPGDTGEVVVRSPGVFMGYLDHPELSAEVLTEDGWFWTGDVGVFDAEGYLFLVDRIKDIIIVSGFNVYPAEVESVLMEHPEVRGAIVVGTPDGRTGEAVVAHVSGSVDTDELDAFCRERLMRYKCPIEYHIVDELPVAPSGKLLRRAVR